MDIYEKLNIKKIINASETYTVLGGSLMDEKTLRAMEAAANAFVDFTELLDKANKRAALLTNNESAFISSGAGACLILAVAAAMIKKEVDKQTGSVFAELLDSLPDTSCITAKEVLVLRGEYLESVPYWKLIKNTGAKVVMVDPVLSDIEKAITEKTAAIVLFPSPLYERNILSCEQILPVIKNRNITTIVDASAQLPPASNLYYYTRKLCADIAIFSGGKHIKGPQCTGLMVGNPEITHISEELASPHERLGRGFKTGKEEIAGLIAALEQFVEEGEEERYQRQEKLLQIIWDDLSVMPKINIKIQKEGRLGTFQPLLLIELPAGKSASECNDYTRSRERPVDIGVYAKEFQMPDNVIFINAYNLQNTDEALEVSCSVKEYLNF